MASRKTRRGAQQNEPKMKASAKKQFVIMLISIALMVFSVTQVYYLAKYTLGHDVPQEKLKVYRWVCMLLEGSNETTTEE
ncbi:MAG: hypothetical protein IJ272_06335 [Clostridia bacterium]|nr:hypothetical protein [Clostridia bacterium]